MAGKKRGRKQKGHTKDYMLGYHAGWARSMRKALGQIPITRKVNDKLKSEDYQMGMRNGLKAGKRFFGNSKVNRE